jgi:NitT/TauT family transport system substrate-binding protein/putative hydroxymethylpyrimidine transport system substrate-binding protein
VTRLAIVLIALLCLAGCGDDGGSSAPDRVTLALDFTPNAVHAPIYAARDAGHGIELRIRKPGSGPDSLKLVASGRADLGILDIHDLALAEERGADVVAIGALVEKPLAALVGQPGIERPKDLEGRVVGVSGLPSDPAFLRAILDHDGADYGKVKQVVIGFSAVTRLLSKRVDAVPVFWNAEGVALRRKGLDISEFRVEDFGAPAYPEVVLITSRKTLAAKHDVLERTLAAIADGVTAARAHPAATTKTIAAAAQTDDLGLIRAQLDATLPLLGTRLDRDVLEQWAAFDARIGIVKARPDVDRAFDFTLAR